jgi:hypothetical protein
VVARVRAMIQASTEIYGFVAWVTTWVLAAAFLVWAVLPTRETIRSTFCEPSGAPCMVDAICAELPDRHWSLALPAFAVALVAFVIVAYFAHQLRIVAPLDSAHAHTSSSQGQARPSQPVRGTIPPIEEIPLAVVTRHLFAPNRSSCSS